MHFLSTHSYKDWTDSMIFLFTSITFFLVIVYFMPKKISYFELYATSLFAAVLQLLTDTFLELKYGLYGYFDPGVDFMTLFIIFLVYPNVNMIFLNYYPFQKHIAKKLLYIIGFSAFALLYEWISVQVGIFYYDGWKLIYSIPIYPVIYLVILLNFYLVRFLEKKNDEVERT